MAEVNQEDCDLCHLEDRSKELMAFVLDVTMETTVKSTTGLPGLQHQRGDGKGASWNPIGPVGRFRMPQRTE